MNKSIMFKILAKSSRKEIIELSENIQRNHEVLVIKEPAKTLVMVKMHEPVANSKFYLGEVIACESLVKIDGKSGMAVTAGDDFDKVLAMAIIDAAYNAKVPEIDWLTEKLNEMNKIIDDKEKRESAIHLKTKVNFRNMGGNDYGTK
ncbi:phosphonate C-P lyase system protein PhnG [Sedimentibacter sp. MB31-C6]|uniref:phosphonate C-P lyase system protein PhnG n=1 Tax=Sedimentibacter sp. MB31-C6 TaxID=3109366 RepID=UPI002DDC997F|nr:phosphonate C-P lyase system protein PhnG [Sedimentibacter sp. MB36-C1]WSI03620.1 phosphonate C-P lyase system protein PhnG [Sedimentibacter sp. MB36-C1]